MKYTMKQLTLLLLSLAAYSQTKDTYQRTLGAYTVATLPSPSANSVAIVTDGLVAGAQ